MRWMKLEPIIQSEVSQKEKEHYSRTYNILLQNDCYAKKKGLLCKSVNSNYIWEIKEQN